MIHSIGLDHGTNIDKIDNISRGIFIEFSTLIYIGRKPKIGTLTLLDKSLCFPPC